MAAVFRKRGGAYLLDIVLLFVVLGPIGFLVQLILDLQPRTRLEIWETLLWNFSLPVWLYFTIADCSRGGATVGKWLLGIRVVTTEGERVSVPQALLRTAIKLLPWELVHLSAFALASEATEFRTEQWAGLGIANALAVSYLVVAAVTGGRRTVHDFVVATEVRRVP